MTMEIPYRTLGATSTSSTSSTIKTANLTNDSTINLISHMANPTCGKSAHRPPRRETSRLARCQEKRPAGWSMRQTCDSRPSGMQGTDSARTQPDRDGRDSVRTAGVLCAACSANSSKYSSHAPPNELSCCPYSSKIYISMGRLVRDIFLFTISIAKGIDKIRPCQTTKFFRKLHYQLEQ